VVCRVSGDVRGGKDINTSHKGQEDKICPLPRSGVYVCMYVWTYKQHGTGVRACVCVRTQTDGRTDDAYRRLSLSTDVTGAERGGGRGERCFNRLYVINCGV